MAGWTAVAAAAAVVEEYFPPVAMRMYRESLGAAPSKRVVG